MNVLFCAVESEHYANELAAASAFCVLSARARGATIYRRKLWKPK